MKIELDLAEALEKRYAIRPTGRPDSTLEVSIPREVIEREARRRKVSVEKFVDEYQAVWYFNSFQGLHLDFEKKPRRKK